MDFLRRMSAAMSILDALEEQAEELSIRKHFALQAGNQKRYLKLDREMKQVQAELAIAGQSVIAWTDVTNLFEARQRILEVSVRVSVAQTAQESWLRYLALIDVVQATAEGFAGAAETELDVRAGAQRLEVECLTAIDLAIQSVPKVAFLP